MTWYIVFCVYLVLGFLWDYWYQNKRIKSLLELYFRVRMLGTANGLEELRNITDEIQDWLDVQGKRSEDV